MVSVMLVADKLSDVKLYAYAMISTVPCGSVDVFHIVSVVPLVQEPLILSCSNKRNRF